MNKEEILEWLAARDLSTDVIDVDLQRKGSFTLPKILADFDASLQPKEQGEVLCKCPDGPTGRTVSPDFSQRICNTCGNPTTPKEQEQGADVNYNHTDIFVTEEQQDDAVDFLESYDVENMIIGTRSDHEWLLVSDMMAHYKVFEPEAAEPTEELTAQEHYDWFKNICRIFPSDGKLPVFVATEYDMVTFAESYYNAKIKKA